MAGQFPGARDIGEFWQVLRGARPVSADGRLAEPDAFDPLFFRIAPLEAEGMSRHQRLVLVESWRALEDAAIVPSALAGAATSLFIGAEPSGAATGSFTGSSDAIIASRLAYFLDLRGGAIVVNTGCSSSATAIHLACEQLRRGEADMALAGGVFANLNPDIVAALTRIGMVSASRRCRTFDAAADGTMMCEGVGIVVLKRLRDALAAGDPVRGVIVASGMNQDGASNGITAPNGTAQEELLASAYRRFGVAPETITYLEAHGTGTALGDPVEANALIRAFRRFTDKEGFCRLGSVKATIGHASAAAGVIGLIKILLCMEKGELPGLEGFTTLNPLIDLAGTAFRIETNRAPWIGTADRPLLAGLSAFGHSGTNVHFVVRAPDAAATARGAVENSVEAVPLSARTPAQLHAVMIGLREFLREKTTAVAPAPAVFAQLRACLCGLLGVDAAAIDLDEPLEDLGVGAEQILRLRQTVEATSEAASAFAQLLASAIAPDLTLREIAQAATEAGADGVGLADLAFTLQRGREHLDARAVFFVRSVAELIGQIEARIDAADGPSPVPPGTPAALVRQAERWLAGENGVWEQSGAGSASRRIHIPCYPFAAGLSPEGTRPDASRTPPAITTRPATEPARDKTTEPARGKTPVGPIMFAPVWETTKVDFHRSAPRSLLLMAERGDARADAVRLACPGVVETPMDGSGLTKAPADAHLLWLAPIRRPEAADAETPALALLRLARRLCEYCATETPLTLTVVTRYGQATHGSEPLDPHQAATHGLAGTIAKEFPNWRVCVVDMAPQDGAWSQDNIQSLLALPADRRGRPWAARSVDDDAAATGVRLQWRRQILVPLQPQGAPPQVYRRGGVYIVIGGAGDVGGFWSEHAVRSAAAQIVWVGRRPEDDGIRAKMSRIGASGPTPVYLRADATDPEALTRIRDETRRLFGRIDGVIHSALDFFERGVGELDDETFLRGFFSKALSAERMVEAFAGERLDFVAMFSSVVSQIRNPRQAAYAAGCAFNDALAHEWNRLSSCPVRTINWGYWSSAKDEVADESAYRAFLRLADIGLGLIEPAEGMRAFDWMLAGPLQQIGLVKTTKPVEIEGLDPSRQLRLPTCLSNSTTDLASDCVVVSLDVARLRNEGEIPGLEPILLDLLACRLEESGVLDGRRRPSGSHIDLWASDSLRRLESAGVIIREGTIWRRRIPGDAGACWRDWRALCAACETDAAKAAQATLLDAVLQGLPDVLAGRRKPTDVLFPNGAMRLVENVHRHNPVAGAYHRNVAALAMALLRRRSATADGPLRVLEIGAGTGGTTSWLLEALDEAGNSDVAQALAEYAYTDISKAFLQHGEGAFSAGRPFLRFRMFDVGESPEDQGFSPCAYDLILAANVLHATPDIRRTIRGAKTLLRPGGVLLASEISVNALFTHLTFGLLEGWWLAQDPDLRIPGSPGMTPGAWRATLHEEGFPEIVFPLEDAHELGQQIIVAVSDGIVSCGGSRDEDGLGEVDLLDVDLLDVDLCAGTAPPPVVDAAPAQTESPAYEADAVALIRGLVAATLKMPLAELDPASPLDRYGMDSILAVKLAEDLGAHFEHVSSALVFEHQTVADIAGYFQRTQPVALASLLPAMNPSAAIPSHATTSRPTAPPAPAKRASIDPSPAMPARDDDRIAVIGMSGRFPGAATTGELWRRIVAGAPAIGDLPGERWDQRQLDIFCGQAATFNTRGGYIDDIASFDPAFFGIAPSEARWMDPRQRLFLEEAWRAFEDAGAMGAHLRGSNCGVFVGVEEGEYGYLTGGRGQISSNQISSLPARIAHVLDLHGPVFALSAACASGLVAAHQACQALRAGECDLALAGGVSMMLSPLVHLGLAHGQMLSPDGVCRVFDAAANGMAPADGVAAVVLKRLGDAVRDNDRIYGCIRTSGVNYDGKTMGFTTPNPRSQAQLVRSLYERAGIAAESIQLVLAHSVGSPLTDPVETQALTDAYVGMGAAPGGCALASVKPLIGHAFAASGVINLIVMLLAIRHDTLPATHGFRTAHPRLRLEGSPFVVYGENRAWERPTSGVRRGALGATGLSGTNAHMVIEEFLAPQSLPAPAGPQIFPFSARTDAQLAAVMQRFLVDMAASGERPLADVAYTLQIGREAFERRVAVVAQDPEELRRRVKEAIAQHGDLAAYPTRAAPRTSAQGAGGLATLLAGSAGDAFLARLVAERDLQKLAHLWTQGCALDWRALHEGAEPGRVSLPGYPFARERYWALDADSNGARAGTVATAPSANVVPDAPRAGAVPPSGNETESLLAVIRRFLATQLEMPESDLSEDVHWREYGVDSLIETRLTLMIEEWLGLDLTGREVFEHPTIRALAEHLATCAVAWAPAEPSAAAPTETGALSEGQLGLWMLEKFHPGAPDYNVPIAFRVSGSWDVTAFEKAARAIFARFPVLRSVVVETDGDARLGTVSPEALDLRLTPSVATDRAAEIALLRAAAREPFDLQNGPLMRFRIWTGGETGDLVLIVVHHLVFDGASAATFFKALWNAYDGFVRGEPTRWPDIRASYQEFVAWERDMLAGARGRKLRNYWSTKLAGAPMSIELATDRVDAMTTASGPGATHRRRLTDALAARLRDIARRYGVRESAIFLALHQALIARLGRCLDPVIGLTAMVRPQQRFEATIGYFVNTLPIRHPINPDASFATHVRQLQDTMLEALDHAEYPFPVLVREVAVGASRGATPVFQTVFAFQNFVAKRLKAAENNYSKVLSIEAVDELTQEGGYPLALEVAEQEDTFLLSFKYSTDLWNSDTIESLATSFVALACAFAEAPEAPWSEIRPPAPSDSWIRSPDAEQDAQTDIVVAIEEAAKARGDAPAVIFASEPPQSISYRSLMARVERLALSLATIAPVGAPIGVCLERSIDSIVVLLALLKCGAVYTPLDPQEARERLAGIVEAARIAYVVTQNETAVSLADCGAAQPAAFAIEALLATETTAEAGKNPADAASPAYILFTSGTTGKPKGVVIERGALSAHCARMRRALGVCEQDCVLQFTPLHLDPSLEQILVALSAGARVVMRDGDLWSAATFWERLATHQVTIADVTPSYLRELLAEIPEAPPSALRTLVVGGEAFPLALYRRLRESALKAVTVVNAYGPTEATITSTLFRMTAATFVPEGLRTAPIGRPLPGVEVLLLDAQGKAVAEGFPGEIHIGGVGLARGYVALPELTAALFAACPEGGHGLASSPRMFRTGDLGRYVPGTKGLIECLGRLDRQVKIRGVRVELDEVAHAIRACPGVLACDLTTEAGTDGDARLTATVTFTPGADAGGAAPFLRKFLAARLPLPMIPTRIRIAGVAEAEPRGTPFVEYSTDVPGFSEVAAIWREVLQVSEIAVDDDFFDAGGHSLLAVRLLHRIERRFGVRMPLAEFLMAPTLAAICGRLGITAYDRTPNRDPSSFPAPVLMIHAGDGPFPVERVFVEALDPVPLEVVRLPQACGSNGVASVEDIAEGCTDYILRQFPKGPYRLCGWSFAGVVAYEIARRLQSAGETVALVCLLDAYTPQFLQEAGAAAADVTLEIFRRGVCAAIGIDLNPSRPQSGDGVEDVIDMARETGAIETVAEAERLRRSYAALAAQTAAMDAYTPMAYAGDILLLRAREEKDRLPGAENFAGWDRCCQGRIDVVVVQGGHFDMLRPPVAAEVARALCDRIKGEPAIWEG